MLIVTTVLMAVTAAALAAASLVHAGVELGVSDRFPGAVIPEAVIAAVLAVGVVSLLVRWSLTWPIALATVVSAIGGVILGVTFTIRGGRTGDLAFHLSLVLALLVTLGLLFAPGARREVSSS